MVSWGICCCPPQDPHSADLPKRVERMHPLRAFHEEELSVDDRLSTEAGVRGRLHASGSPGRPASRSSSPGTSEFYPASPSQPHEQASSHGASANGSSGRSASPSRQLQPKTLSEVFVTRPEIPARGCASTPEERVLAKEKLKGLLTEFLKAVFSGIWVVVINPETAASSEFVMTMDRHLFVTLRPKIDGKEGLMGFELKDGFSLHKGEQVTEIAPKLGEELAKVCVCIEQTKLGVQLFFYWPDEWECELFYSCLKVLQMSADISRKTKDTNNSNNDGDGLPVPAHESGAGSRANSRDVAAGGGE